MRLYSPSVLSALTRYHGFNGGALVVTGVLTDLVVLDMGLVVPGQIFWVNSRVRLTKGGVVGDSLVQVDVAAGTATINFLSGLGSVDEQFPNHPVGLQWTTVMGFTGIILSGGTLFLRTRAQSLGSDSNCGIGDANMQVIKINR